MRKILQHLLVNVFFILLAANYVTAQTGYIYVHSKALNENGSPDINYTMSGGPIASFTLNDNPNQNPVKDLGSSQNGRLWAVTADNTVWYRDSTTSNWVHTTITGASRIDGGPGVSAYYIAGGVVYQTANGTTSTAISGSIGATDIGSGWNNTMPYIIVGNSLQRYSGAGTTWNIVYANSPETLVYVDVNPQTNDAYVVVNVSSNNSRLLKITPAGVATNLGRPASTAGNIAMRGIAVTASGRVFAESYYNVAPQGHYVFEWLSGTTWSSPEFASFDVSDLTGGSGDEVWSTMNSGGWNNFSYPFYNIFTRYQDGAAIGWIDDERVRAASPTGNSIMIPVTAGTYTITETIPAGWDLQKVTVYDPTSNSTSNQVANTATVNVAAGEVVNVVFQTGQLNPFAMTNDCGALYTETFGTGAIGTFGNPVAGQTTYHFLNTGQPTGTPGEDGYFKIVSVANPDFNTWASGTNLYDHTSGNGTGRMLAVNAGYDKGEFFRRRFTGVIPGATYNFSAWITTLTIATVPVNVNFQVLDHVTQNVLGSYSTGNFTGTTAPAPWTKYGFSFLATSSDVDLVLSNNGLGGNGNDLAIDDISFQLMPTASAITTITNASCGSSVGNITVTSPVGASYQYSKDGTNWQASTNFTNLTPGIYTISTNFTGTVNCISTVIDTVKAAVCGTVFDDANGNTIMNAGETGTTAGTSLYVYLVDASGIVIDSAKVLSDGTYTLHATPNATYNIELSTIQYPLGTNTATTPIVTTPPAGWVTTGENGTGAGTGDGTPNGILSVTVATSSLTNRNFGIDQLPTANAVTGTTQQNPGGNAKVTVPTLNGTDPEQGTFPGTGNLDTVIINTLPANGTLYYNGIAVAAGDTIKNYNPALLTVDPNDGISSLSFTYSEVDAALKSSSPATVTMPFTTAAVFACGSGLAYQVASPGAASGNNSSLYSYNVNTGVRTLVAALNTDANAIGYNPVDNLIWGVNQNTAKVERIDANGVVTSFTIPNLPVQAYNVGDVLPGGYLFLTLQSNSKYYVVDINPSHANYLQLVDPTAGYIIDTSPFGTSITPSVSIIQDWAYNTATGLLTSVVNPSDPNKFKVVTLNPATGVETLSATAVNGDNIQTETVAFGGIFKDASGNNLYVFANNLGKFYKVDLSTNIATLLSTSVSAANNDGANCPLSVLSVSISGKIINDVNANTLLDGTETGTTAGTNLYVYLVDSTGHIVDSSKVLSDGSYTLHASPNSNYSIELSTIQYPLGNNVATTPIVTTPPSGWVTTGENGTGSGTGDGTPNGILTVTVATSTITNQNLGIQQIPIANNDTGTGTISNPVSLNPLTNDNDPGGGSLNPTTVSIMPPSGVTATNVVVDAHGDTTSFVVPGQGTWSVDSATGVITFTPTPGYTGNPTPISYNVEDNTGIPSNQATVTITYPSATISGTVVNDVNGSGTLTAGETGTTAGTNLYVYLVNSSGVVVDSSKVNPDGTYSLTGSPSTAYTIELSTQQYPVGTNTSTTNIDNTPPSGWVTTGEGSNNTNDGIANGILNVSTGVANTNTANANFGIEQPPVATNDSATGTISNPVSLNPLTNDNDPGGGSLNPTTVSIMPPSGVTATNIVVDAHGDTTSFVVPGQGTWSVDPVTGVITFTPTPGYTGNPTPISYNVEDNAGVPSNQATVTITYPSATISGTVVNDVNGSGTLTAGETGTTAGTNLYVYLVNSSGVVVDSSKVNPDGTYSLTGSPTTAYTIELSTQQYPVGTNTSTTNINNTAPNGWVTTGEGSNNTNDGTANGVLSVSTGAPNTNTANANFGIEQPPIAVADQSLNNTTGTSVTINPLLNDTDAAPGTLDPTTVSIIPPAGITVTGITVDAHGDTTAFTVPGEGTWSVNPSTGAITFTPQIGFNGNPTVIQYNVEDNAGVVSNNANVTITYTAPITISGTVINDVNANTLLDGTETGTTAGTNLYVYLVNASGIVVDSAQVLSNGTYSLDAGQNLNYTIELSAIQYPVGTNTVSTPIVTTPPTGWVTTGENGTGNTGSGDGTPNGILSITTGTSTVSNQNFGIQQPPTAVTGTVPSQVNPGGTNNVTVPSASFDGNDQNGGIVTSVTITGFPTNATSITINNVTYTSATFPAAGVTIPADINGNPMQPISIDPIDGAVTSVITYTATDNGGAVSAPATVSVVFSTLSIAGTVYDDGNGSTPDGTLVPGVTVNLLDASNNIVATTTTDATGNYSFSGLNAGTYNVQIIDPAGYSNVSSTDASPMDGSTQVTLGTANATAVNFGIDQAPNSNNNTASYAVNTPGVVYAVPGLSGSDHEDGIYGNGSTYVVTSLPSGAILYYNNLPVAAGQTISNFDASLLTIDPSDPTLTTSFSFAAIDAAGLQDPTPATITVTWSGILPITLLDFSGNKNDDAVLLQWSTSQEINSAYIEVEKSADAVNFATIGKVIAKGNSNSETDYSFTDDKALAINYYRLKLTDRNGNTSYSKIISVKLNKASVLITNVTPDPFIDQIQAVIELQKASQVNIEIFDVSGKRVYKNAFKGTSGTNKIAINDLGNLSKGMYIINVAADNIRAQQKVIKAGN